MKHPVITCIFLGLAAAAVAVGCLGFLRMRGAAAKLHFAGWTALTAPPWVMAAIVCNEGFSEAGTRAILITVLLFLEAPITAHVLGRAIHSHEHLPKVKNQ